MNTKGIVDTAIAKVVAPVSDEMPNVARDFVLAMVNEGYHKIESAALWKFSEAEEVIPYTAGNQDAATPSDLGIPLMVLNSKREPLGYWDDRQEAYPNEARGTLRAYSMWEGKLRLWPIPASSGNLILRYYRVWGDLTDSTGSEPILPPTWQHLLHEYAAGKLAQRLPARGERFLTYSRAEPYITSFETDLARMLQSDLVMKTFDEVPNHSFYNDVLSIGEW